MNPSFPRILKPDIKKVKHFTIEDIPRMGESVAEVTKPSSKETEKEAVMFYEETVLIMD